METGVGINVQIGINLQKDLANVQLGINLKKDLAIASKAKAI